MSKPDSMLTSEQLFDKYGPNAPARNEAADILRGHLAHLTRETVNQVAWLGALDNALSAERRATVERIRDRLGREIGVTVHAHDAEVVAILEEEAAR